MHTKCTMKCSLMATECSVMKSDATTEGLQMLHPRGVLNLIKIWSKLIDLFIFCKVNLGDYPLTICDQKVFILFLHFAAASSIITSSEPLLQGQTLVSPDTSFELGFFDPNNSGNRYVGIWYKNISPRVVVWVANGGNPAVNSPSILQIGTKDGNLVLVDAQQSLIWSTNVSTSSNSSIAELSNGGNLILRNPISGILWQSALNPGNTALPGTWEVTNVTNGRSVVMTSWKAETDPSPGSYTVGITPISPPQAFTWKDSKPYWRSGQWDKSKFIGIRDADETYLSYYTVLDDTEKGAASVTLRTVSGCTFANLVLLPSGDLKYMCYETGKGWSIKWQEPQSPCDVYGICGPNGICVRSDPIACKCIEGFEPKKPENWRNGNWTEGCVRRSELSCVPNSGMNQTTEVVPTDRFLRIQGLKLPDFSEYVDVSNAGCKERCLVNCTCVAYAFVDGIGCLVWSVQVLDVADLSPQGEDLYVRLANSEFAEAKKAVKWIIISIALSSFAVICFTAYCFIKRRAKDMVNRKARIITNHTRRSNLEGEDPVEVPLFDLDCILDTTSNFSETNKLGQGGFGPVYKGTLNGIHIAIKRLSSSSVQGSDEFKTEIMLISKLQHRNLVKLLGYCIERDEKLLIYEFMPHKSLDTYLFDSTKNTVLDWPQRFNIILGIARGLSYLHRDSHLRVVHRDLKASNILLDEKMNPKISDFGLARNFEGTQVLANTHRVVGTLGYLSPEYAMGGIFSEKSDVFSFGVLVLEIITGKRITSFHYDGQYLGLLDYAWQSWIESKEASMIDEAIEGSFSQAEVAKCVKIGLLVQYHAVDRPTMPTVVFMLNGDTNSIPNPKQPAALSVHTAINTHIRSHSHLASSENELTKSIIEGR